MFFEEEIEEDGSDEAEAPKLKGRGGVVKDGGHGLHGVMCNNLFWFSTSNNDINI